MNWFDWMILGAAVGLWLRLEVLFHKHDVLRTEHDNACANGDRRIQGLRRDTLSWLEFDAFSRRLIERIDKLDPPRRRATDKVKQPCHCGPSADGYVKLQPGCPHFNPCCKDKKAAKR